MYEIILPAPTLHKIRAWKVHQPGEIRPHGVSPKHRFISPLLASSAETASVMTTLGGSCACLLSVSPWQRRNHGKILRQKSSSKTRWNHPSMKKLSRGTLIDPPGFHRHSIPIGVQARNARPGLRFHCSKVGFLGLLFPWRPVRWSSVKLGSIEGLKNTESTSKIGISLFDIIHPAIFNNLRNGSTTYGRVCWNYVILSLSPWMFED